MEAARPGPRRELAAFKGDGSTVCDYPDGRLEIEHDGIVLPYRTCDRVRGTKRAEVVENKRIDEVLAIAAQVVPLEPAKRSSRTPRRRGQSGHMFAVEKSP